MTSKNGETARLTRALTAALKIDLYKRNKLIKTKVITASIELKLKKLKTLRSQPHE